ncbi:MAG TPA: hypothetical protein VFR96_01155 [Povalibacter sp.]|nr:hypothetical protein [Povalibacter sp.]
MIRGIKWRSLLIAMFAFYVAPLLPLIVVSSIPNFFGAEAGQRFRIWQSPFVLVLAWFYAIAPVGAAYLAAKLAGQQPLLHGLLIGLVGAVLVVLWVQGGTVAFEAILALLVLSCGLFGGWLWRYRHAQRSVAL